MARAPAFCGVILAAGESTRMGNDKALLPWPPARGSVSAGRDTFLSAAISSLLRVCDLVLVVAGKNEEQLTPIVYANNASLVRNPAPERGQFSSLQVGLQEVLNRGRDAAIITLVDRPPVRSATLQALHDAFVAAPMNVWAVIPEYKGHHGHPFVSGRELIHQWLEAPPTATAREIEHQYPAHIEYLPVDDPYVAINVDTPQDYASLQNEPVLK
jgi:molybdenum cofactor cytidylyltransferase